MRVYSVRIACIIALTKNIARFDPLTSQTASLRVTVYPTLIAVFDDDISAEILVFANELNLIKRLDIRCRDIVRSSSASNIDCVHGSS